jgi:hypothetical protein
MPAASEHQILLDTIVMLAEQIARTSPVSADQAMRIVKLVHELDPAPDRSLIKDALDMETADSDLSDARVQTTADAVMRAVKASP